MVEKANGGGGRGILRSALLAVLLLLLLLLAVTRGAEAPAAVARWLESVRSLWWAPGAFIALYVVFNLVLFPATVLTLTAGLLWGWLEGGLWVLLASTIASVPPYLLARSAGASLRARIERRSGKLHTLLRDQGGVTLLLLRLVPIVPYNLLNYAAGAAGLRLRDYAAATFFGTIPGIFIYTALADALAAGLVTPRQAVARVLVAGSLLAGLILVTRFAAGRVRRRLDPTGSGVESAAAGHYNDPSGAAPVARRTNRRSSMPNPLARLNQSGQSVWYDQMERALLTTGRLKKMIDEDDLRGLTSNPTIFEKAISGSKDYDEALAAAAGRGADSNGIYEALVLDDIGRAADVFLPVWQKTKGLDGYVSLEVSPLLAHDTAETVSEAHRLFGALGRPNVMIKVPATPAGIPAIEELIAAGLNINVTLIFSRAVYAQVMDAYLRGLERRVERGLPVDQVSSVASFFVSRIDSKADAALKKKIEESGSEEEKARLRALLGKVAIANAKLAYRLFKETFSGSRWAPLRARGARVQRPLWASTGTKDPAYSDVLYIEELIGPDTVNTIPPKTYDAFRDHGKVAPTLGQGIGEAEDVLHGLEDSGISLDRITDQLTVEGVKSFSESFESLMTTIGSRGSSAPAGVGESEGHPLGKALAGADEALAELNSTRALSRLWSRDASLWKEEHRSLIEQSLGWLSVPSWTLDRVEEILSFAREVRGQFDHAVVLGMGGSSLCAEVLRTSFGKQKGWPALHVLDSTVPAAVAALESRLDLARTLFIVASKSGSTTEPVMFQKYFWQAVERATGAPGRAFIAITDPRTALNQEAERDGFRRIFLNPPDIGGRYSALSMFGMVPAAISGIDIRAMLQRAVATAKACGPEAPPGRNPGLRLAAILGGLARRGRDKVTLHTSQSLPALGLWIEQLVAESTGKEGKGILPIALEPLARPEAYGEDRLFVRIRLRSEDPAGERRRFDELSAAGHPVLDRVLEDPLDLGSEFFVWEVATALTGALLHIDPFDQPNVQESKDNTKRLLGEFRASGRLPEPSTIGAGGAISVSGRAPGSGNGDARELVESLLAQARAGDYVALLAYLREDDSRNRTFARIRSAIMEALTVATTAGYGPRFLHSTGQFHKGGPTNGIFLQITGDEGADLPIPGEPFGFRTLAAAQALGDFEALEAKGRRALRLHLSDVDRGLAELSAIVESSGALRR